MKAGRSDLPQVTHKSRTLTSKVAQGLIRESLQESILPKPGEGGQGHLDIYGTRRLLLPEAFRNPHLGKPFASLFP